MDAHSRLHGWTAILRAAETGINQAAIILTVLQEMMQQLRGELDLDGEAKAKGWEAEVVSRMDERVRTLYTAAPSLTVPPAVEQWVYRSGHCTLFLLERTGKDFAVAARHLTPSATQLFLEEIAVSSWRGYQQIYLEKLRSELLLPLLEIRSEDTVLPKVDRAAALRLMEGFIHPPLAGAPRGKYGASSFTYAATRGACLFLQNVLSQPLSTLAVDTLASAARLLLWISKAGLMNLILLPPTSLLVQSPSNELEVELRFHDAIGCRTFINLLGARVKLLAELHTRLDGINSVKSLDTKTDPPQEILDADAAMEQRFHAQCARCLWTMKASTITPQKPSPTHARSRSS
jgi:hypothetical protein